jgi:hypothetical protein
VRRAAFVAAVAASLLPAAAVGGALDACVARTGPGEGTQGAGERGRRELTACLNAARRAATDDMLESFLALDQVLGAGAGRGPAPALRQPAV